MLKELIVACVVGAFPVAACAGVPPLNWRPQIYIGPGLLCGGGFNFRLDAGEKATAGFPSEGYVPTTVRSSLGVFGIVAYSFNVPVAEKTLVAHRTNGDVYLIKRVRRAAASGTPKRRSYWFVPRDGSAPPRLLRRSRRGSRLGRVSSKPLCLGRGPAIFCRYLWRSLPDFQLSRVVTIPRRWSAAPQLIWSACSLVGLARIRA